MRSVAVGVALLAVIPASAAAQVEPATTTDEAMPGVSRVRAAGYLEKGLSFAASGGYAFTEEVLGDSDKHHRTGLRLSAALRATNSLAFGLRVDSRLDLHTGDMAGSDEGLLFEPHLFFRASRHFDGGFGAGGHLDLWLPAIQAISADAVAIASYSPIGSRLGTHVNVGFRFDRSAESVDDPSTLTPGDRVAINASDFHAVLLGVGWEVRLESATLLAEWSWDWLVGSDAPDPLDSPMRVGAGARFGTRDWLLTAMVEASVSDSPALGPGRPLVPTEPLIGLSFGVARAPTRVRVTPERIQVRREEKVDDAPKKGTLVGVIKTADGEPVAGAMVRVGGTLQFTTDDSGKFETGELDPGTIDVGVFADGYDDGEKSVSIVAGKETRLEITVESQLPPGQIRGVIQSIDGTPLAAKITVAEREEAATADEQGSFQLDLPPGEYEVTVSATGYESQTRAVQVEQNSVVLLNLDLEPAK